MNIAKIIPFFLFVCINYYDYCRAMEDQDIFANQNVKTLQEQNEEILIYQRRKQTIKWCVDSIKKENDADNKACEGHFSLPLFPSEFIHYGDHFAVDFLKYREHQYQQLTDCINKNNSKNIPRELCHLIKGLALLDQSKFKQEGDIYRTSIEFPDVRIFDNSPVTYTLSSATEESFGFVWSHLKRFFDINAAHGVLTDGGRKFYVFKGARCNRQRSRFAWDESHIFTPWAMDQDKNAIVLLAKKAIIYDLPTTNRITPEDNSIVMSERGTVENDDFCPKKSVVAGHCERFCVATNNNITIIDLKKSSNNKLGVVSFDIGKIPIKSSSKKGVDWEKDEVGKPKKISFITRNTLLYLDQCGKLFSLCLANGLQLSNAAEWVPQRINSVYMGENEFFLYNFFWLERQKKLLFLFALQEKGAQDKTSRQYFLFYSSLKAYDNKFSANRMTMSPLCVYNREIRSVVIASDGTLGIICPDYQDPSCNILELFIGYKHMISNIICEGNKLCSKLEGDLQLSKFTEQKDIEYMKSLGRSLGDIVTFLKEKDNEVWDSVCDEAMSDLDFVGEKTYRNPVYMFSDKNIFDDKDKCKNIMRKRAAQSIKIAKKSFLKDLLSFNRAAERFINPKVQKLFDLAFRLEGLTRHASKHAAGIVISPEPIDEVLPVYVPPKTTELVTQYAMTELEELGFLKIDLLGLKNLTLIDRTIRMITENHAIDINIDSLTLDDQKTFALLGADLLRAFDDQQALIEYDNAAQLYEKNNKYLSAAAIYEHLIAIDAQRDDHLYKCLEMYRLLEMHESIVRLVKRFVLMRLEFEYIDRIDDILEKYAQSIDIFLAVDIYETVLLWLISQKSSRRDLKEKYLTKTIEGLKKQEAEESISRLIKKIELVDSTLLCQENRQ